MTIRTCPMCKTNFTRYISKKDQRKNKSGLFFCSRSCSASYNNKASVAPKRLRKCAWKHCSNTLNRKGSKFCSNSCKSKAYVDKNRKETKKKAVDLAGGCELCGYDDCISALEFHHKDPSMKSFGISNKGLTRKWELVKLEIAKCMLLCSNCHRELHSSEDTE